MWRFAVHEKAVFGSCIFLEGAFKISAADKSEFTEAETMKIMSILLIAAGIVCALFSDKIDEVVKGNKKVKKAIVIFSVGILLVGTITIIVGILS